MARETLAHRTYLVIAHALIREVLYIVYSLITCASLSDFSTYIVLCGIKNSNRHKRRKCGHCNEELSYTAFRSHKSLYYDESTKEWAVCSKLRERLEDVPEMDQTAGSAADVRMDVDTTKVEYQPSSLTGIAACIYRVV